MINSHTAGYIKKREEEEKNRNVFTQKRKCKYMYCTPRAPARTLNAYTM